MSKLHTHYDNLKVARNAPIEIIHSAYGTLLTIYQDRSRRGDTEAQRIMKLIDTAYGVLKDPELRRAHDHWISEQEKVGDLAEQERIEKIRKSNAHFFNSIQREQLNRTQLTKMRQHLGKNYSVYMVAIAVIGLVFYSITNQNSLGTPRWDQGVLRGDKSSDRPQNLENGKRTGPDLGRPDLFPGARIGDINLKPLILSDVVPTAKGDWPKVAGYIDGTVISQSGGQSSLTIDNSKNNLDVFVKLTNSTDGKGTAYRQIFVPANQSFVMDALLPSIYAIRWSPIQTGDFYKSEPFTINETKNSAGGITSTRMVISLHSVPNGNMHMEPISKKEF